MPITMLRYEISLVPKISIPSAALVHVVRAGLPANLKAVALRAEEVCDVEPHSLIMPHLYLQKSYEHW